jgi:AcrR family transcriptional regulator
MIRSVSSDTRPLRADAARNRRKLLDAAHKVFAERGLDAGVDEIALEAGVGMGTLYRRFPTKDQLIGAIIDQRFEELDAAFAEAARIEDPWDGFVATATALAAAIAEDRGFYQVVSESVPRLASIVPDNRARLLGQIGPVLHRAQEAGVVRADVVETDIPGLCAVAARLPRWRLDMNPDAWRRVLAIVLDGLRPEGATPLPEDAGLPLPEPAPAP